MKRRIVFFEALGGNDKGPDGMRKDTMPMVDALRMKGYEADVIFFEERRKDAIFKDVSQTAAAYVSRINPGNLQDETIYFDLLRELCEAGVIGMPHPDAMINYGSKDALIRLKGTSLVPDDTYAYDTMSELMYQFPRTLARGERVLKQNRGSTGEGIWRVELAQPQLTARDSIPLSTPVICTEAKNNESKQWELGNFLLFCEQYVEERDGRLIDMPFLPRIREGEIRILMLQDEPVNVVHKQPIEGKHAFSATLFSGAHYRYDPPILWNGLITQFLNDLPMIQEKLGHYDLPLLWTADFILRTDESGNDTYVLGEMNGSCVGFTSHLSLADDIADAIIQTVVSKQRQVPLIDETTP